MKLKISKTSFQEFSIKLDLSNSEHSRALLRMQELRELITRKYLN